MTNFFRITKCGDLFSVKSEKAEGGSLAKRILVLQELGTKHADSLAVSLLGGLAQLEFKEGDVVAASLRFQTRDYNGQTLQDITALSQAALYDAQTKKILTELEGEPV